MSAHTQQQASEPWPQVAHLGVAAGLLIVSIALDFFRPFERTFSVFYLAPVLYAGWALRGHAPMVFGLTVMASALTLPLIRSSQAPGLNRAMGAAVGILVFVLMRDRARYADALIEAKSELEDKVKTRTAELERLNSEYQSVIAVKEQFVSNMSHEIRTPLNGILGMAELLSESAAPDDQANIIQDLRTSGQVLRSMVDDLLDLSRLDAGRLQLRQVPFSLRDTVAEIVAMVRTEAARKGIAVTSQVPDIAIDHVVGDQLRIRQILTNLVGNAIKFTEQGFLRVAIQPMDVPPGAESLVFEFTVEDSGPGIPTEAQSHIFDKFSQLDASTTRRYGGSGLGLSIAKNLVLLMHGQIGVKSKPGAGSTFWFRIPLQLAAPRAAVELMAPRGVPPVGDYTGLRVAIAEDNAISRRLLLRFLEKLGCAVEACSSGRELLELTGTSHFDAVFMDLHMPGMDGLETTRQLRRMQGDGAGRARTVVVAVTAAVMEQDRDACLAAGMDDYLSKPVNFNELRATLGRWCGNRAARGSVSC